MLSPERVLVSPSPAASECRCIRLFFRLFSFEKTLAQVPDPAKMHSQGSPVAPAPIRSGSRLASFGCRSQSRLTAQVACGLDVDLVQEAVSCLALRVRALSRRLLAWEWIEPS